MNLFDKILKELEDKKQQNLDERLYNPFRNEALDETIEIVKKMSQEKTCISENSKKWEQLDKKISKFYEEDSEGNLLDIGLAAAEAFGYL